MLPPMISAVSPLPSHLADLAPQDVRDASQAFATAVERSSAAAHALNQARQGLRDAKARDQRAAASAAHEGEPLPKATVPKAAQVAGDAERSAEAEKSAALARLDAYLAAVRGARESILAAARARLAEVGTKGAEYLAELELSLGVITDLHHLVGQLDGNPLGGSGASFNPSHRFGKRTNADTLTSKVRQLVDALKVELDG